jgi:hypothetical protein
MRTCQHCNQPLSKLQKAFCSKDCRVHGLRTRREAPQEQNPPEAYNPLAVPPPFAPEAVYHEALLSTPMPGTETMVREFMREHQPLKKYRDVPDHDAMASYGSGRRGS